MTITVTATVTPADITLTLNSSDGFLLVNIDGTSLLNGPMTSNLAALETNQWAPVINCYELPDLIAAAGGNLEAVAEQVTAMLPAKIDRWLNPPPQVPEPGEPGYVPPGGTPDPDPEPDPEPEPPTDEA